MKKIRILLIVLLAGSAISPAWAGEFTVNTATALQNILAVARNNGEDDVITMEPGVYTLGASLSYTPGENQGLLLEGAGADLTVIDGGNTMQILKIDVSGLADDANASIRIRGVAFRKGNGASDSGGGVSVKTKAAAVLVEDCVFEENISSGQSGGGLYISSTDGRIEVNRSTFSANSGALFGGGAYLESVNGEVLLGNSRFIGNASINAGGGAYASSSVENVILVDNVFSGNSSGSGGGSRSTTASGTVNHIHNTSIDNVAVSNGGGAIVTLGDGGDAYLYNNILWNNTAGGAGNDLYVDDDVDGDVIGGIVEVINNDYSIFEYNIGDNLTTTGNFAEDPLLTPDFHLQAASPCIDKGENAMPFFPDFDFEGDPRSVDGDLDGSAAVDLGADEYKAVMAIPAGAESFNYLPVATPAPDTEASAARPLSVGDPASGMMDLSLRLLSFSEPADIFIAFSWPAVDPNYIHLVTAGGALQRFEGAFIPYLSDFEGDIDQSLFGA
ncbi:MAG: hypothetical protein GY859_20630, partial [Desulfobacterales bacterium]|nr:hypothetical protein [Desulfobacterales bacterium]